jgi:Protein of unknown function (DUF3147)
MQEMLLRFLIGGIIVSLFAVLGDVLGPKSFAGLFGAAPSIALATPGLTVHQHGVVYAAQEARSMEIGAVAFFVYATVTGTVLARFKTGTMLTTILLLPIWFAVSLGLYVCLQGSGS